LFQSKPEHQYAWALGIDLFGGGGRIGREGYYGSAAGGFRLKSDYMVNPAAKLGGEGYVQITHLDKGQMQASTVNTLDVVDLGIAGYKHICPPGVQRLCLTPLIGAQLALMSPAGAMDSAGSKVFNYAAAGLRAEVNAQLALGSHYEHVLELSLGLNVYSAVFASPNDGVSPTAADIGLDAAGRFVYLGLGYAYRFSTFGQAPFVTLE
jgi:hypothetical protein